MAPCGGVGRSEPACSSLLGVPGPQAQRPRPHSASCLWWWERGGQEVCSHQLGPFLGGRELWSPVGLSAGESSEILILAISKSFNGLPRRLSGKESSCQCKRHRFDPWVRNIPWGKKWQPTPGFLLENPRYWGTWLAAPWGTQKNQKQLSNQTITTSGCSPWLLWASLSSLIKLSIFVSVFFRISYVHSHIICEQFYAFLNFIT